MGVVHISGYLGIIFWWRWWWSGVNGYASIGYIVDPWIGEDRDGLFQNQSNFRFRHVYEWNE